MMMVGRGRWERDVDGDMAGTLSMLAFSFSFLWV